jgi:hypothetical protein
MPDPEYPSKKNTVDICLGCKQMFKNGKADIVIKKYAEYHGFILINDIDLEEFKKIGTRGHSFVDLEIELVCKFDKDHQFTSKVYELMKGVIFECPYCPSEEDDIDKSDDPTDLSSASINMFENIGTLPTSIQYTENDYNSNLLKREDNIDPVDNEEITTYELE